MERSNHKSEKVKRRPSGSRGDLPRSKGYPPASNAERVVNQPALTRIAQLLARQAVLELTKEPAPASTSEDQTDDA